MDGRIFETALTGDLQKLYQLLGENPLILHTSSLSSAGNPLHVASAFGHVDFVKEIARLKPDFAKEVNQDGFSPLHMASANGQIEVVRELIEVDRKLCHLQGPEKKTPLHCAAIKGRSGVVSEMLSVCPECVEDVTIRSETALHLAIKNNQFETIRVLVNSIRDVKKENILNMKDEQGNTVLHLATWKKQRQVIEFLFGHGANDSMGLEVNAINQCGFTALDVLRIFPSEAGDREIEEILLSAGAMRMRDITLSSFPSPEPCNKTSANNFETAETNQQQSYDLMQYFKFKKGRDSPGETRSALLVVAALVATTTYQFGINPPGGVWQDNSIPESNNSTSSKAHKAGESILGSMNKTAFGLFMVFNCIGFSLSLHMINFLTSNFPLQLELQFCFLAMYFTYNTAVINIAPDGTNLLVILSASITPIVVSLTSYCVRQHRKRLAERTMDP